MDGQTGSQLNNIKKPTLLKQFHSKICHEHVRVDVAGERST